MRTGRPVRPAGVPSGRRFQMRWAAILFVAVTLISVPAQLPAAGGKSLITLRSGEVIEGTVARKMGENYILHTGSGLRVVAVLAVEKIEEAPAEASPSPPRASPPRGSGAPNAGG